MIIRSLGEVDEKQKGQLDLKADRNRFKYASEINEILPKPHLT